MAYEKLNLQTGQEWSDDAAAHFEDGIARAHQMMEDLPEPTPPTWAEVTGKPSTFPPTVGTTATTAAAGNHKHSYNDLNDKPTIPSATAAGTRAQLDAGTDTTVRAFSAKDLHEFVAAQIAAAQATPDPEG